MHHFFGDFYLRPTSDNPDTIQLEWTEKEQDIPFKANELSDGSLRFILLATVLLQPEEYKPSAIIVDEPELGLHPYAIAVLAELIKTASHEHQLIISTQSVELVNEFDAEDLIVVDKKDGASTFKRLEADSLEEWLSDYSLGELWTKKSARREAATMIRINIFVEGQTEETFVRDVLAPAFAYKQIYFTPILAQTSRGHKGGIVSYGKVKHQIERLCKQDPQAWVTT
ncbi:hypothetical protein OS31_12640 [Dickeya oryzae]